ncbi:TonB-dependent receptor plug domain-containing protein [Thalassomonas haliotis]|uniref:TonB-dependent receptor n=1 Tax=Thalassomonas haliotis TaxID=485448 RepID=A0ABY7VG53_9GAMM|nr:TonB-dependent receptor [Thalassomonas haliotis]WDE12710.1 TonB-dependent receptor [Thalassomonas haliotis]
MLILSGKIFRISCLPLPDMARFGRLLALTGLLLPATAVGQAQDELSLEDLMQVEVTSGSKFSQELSDIPAAAYILSKQDIRLTGATNLPELLENIPGVFVAGASANTWAIGSRGFAGVFANKLLVMVDGRSLFSPLFSGVFWDLLDIYINDIKRIEVIRGAGSSIWGANAINGIINIITEASVDTQGLDLYSYFGDQTSHDLGMRYGTSLADGLFAKAYIKQKQIEDFATASEAISDAWQSTMTGVRVDGFVNRDSWYVSADYIEQDTSDISIILASDEQASNQLDNSSWNLTGFWQRLITPDNRLSFAMHIQEQQRSGTSNRLTDKLFNSELDHAYRITPALLLSYGLGYRVNRFTLESEHAFNFIGDNDHARAEIYSGYGQLQLQFNQQQSLQLGSKVERHIHSYGETAEGKQTEHRKTYWFPDIKYLHKVNEQSSFWLSLNKSERVPSMAEHGIDVALLNVPAMSEQNPAPWDIETSFKSNQDFAAEKIKSLEAGYRSLLSPTMSLDMAVFYSDFGQLRSTRQGAVVCRQSQQAPPDCNLPDTIESEVILENDASATSLGVEAYSNWLLNQNIRLQFNYAYLDLDYQAGSDLVLEDAVSTTFYRHSFGIKGDWLQGDRFKVRLAYSAKRRLHSPDKTLLKADTEQLNLSAYYQLLPGVMLSAQVKNLLNDKEYQWFPEFPKGHASGEKQQFLLGMRITF